MALKVESGIRFCRWSEYYDEDDPKWCDYTRLEAALKRPDEFPARSDNA